MYTKNQINKLIDKKCPGRDNSRIYVVAIRSGVTGDNTLGEFNDRCYVIFDHALKGSWIMNTDPSNNIPGRATLNPGVWKFRAGKHHINDPKPKGRAAFRQFGDVTVHRHQEGNDTGEFGINIHDSLSGTTSSEGCQTFQKQNWSNLVDGGFRDVMYRILKVSSDSVMRNPSGIGSWFFYILLDLKEAEAILAA